MLQLFEYEDFHFSNNQPFRYIFVGFGLGNCTETVCISGHLPMLLSSMPVGDSRFGLE